MRSDILNRRAVLAGAGALLVSALLPFGAARAQDTATATTLIDRVVGEVNAIISSGRSEAAMLADFEQVFARYADVDYIARRALGPAARQASPAQLAQYTAAFRGYIARKYGRRFREFIGGRIEVGGARSVNGVVEVTSTAFLQGEPPFDVRWIVSDRSGRSQFIDLYVEGVSMLLSEGAEIRSMLDRRRGDLAALTLDLQTSG